MRVKLGNRIRNYQNLGHLKVTQKNEYPGPAYHLPSLGFRMGISNPPYLLVVMEKIKMPTVSTDLRFCIILECS